MGGTNDVSSEKTQTSSPAADTTTSTETPSHGINHAHHDQLERERILNAHIQQQQTVGSPAQHDQHQKRHSFHHELKHKETEPDLHDNHYHKLDNNDPEAQYQHPRHDGVELDRILTSRLQQQQTVGSTHEPEPREKWLPMGAAKPYPPSLPDSEAYVVEFEGSDDPLHPHNWPMPRR